MINLCNRVFKVAIIRIWLIDTYIVVGSVCVYHVICKLDKINLLSFCFTMIIVNLSPWQQSSIEKIFMLNFCCIFFFTTIELRSNVPLNYNIIEMDYATSSQRHIDIVQYLLFVCYYFSSILDHPTQQPMRKHLSTNVSCQHPHCINLIN